MANEWLSEGFLQLRLAAAWEGYASALAQLAAGEAAAGATGQFSARLRRLVLDPFLLVEWIPGIREVASKLCKPGAAAQEPGALQAYAERIREHFLRSWPADLDQSPGNGVSAEPQAETFRRLLLASFESAMAAARGETDDFPVPLRTHPTRPALELHRTEEIALAWVGQARAVHAWQSVEVESARLQKQREQQLRWAGLGDNCKQAHEELDSSQRWQTWWQARVCSARSSRAVSGAMTVLGQCQEAFGELGNGSRPAQGGAMRAQLDSCGRLAQRISAVLEQAPADWPPRTLAELQHWLTGLDADRYGGLLARLTPFDKPPARWSGWARSLECDLPGLDNPLRARLILFRSVIAALGDCFAPNDVWDRLEAAIRPSLASRGLTLELIRHPGQQQPDWFTVMSDEATGEPRLERIGLVIGNEGGTRTFFPRGVVVGPPPCKKPEAPEVRPQTPEEFALADLDALSRELEELAAACRAAASDGTERAAEGSASLMDLGPGERQALEDKWAQWKTQWEPRGLEALPPSWTFLRQLAWDELGLSEEDISFVFRRNIPRGLVYKVKPFGLRRRGGETIRKGTAYVSAGPSPEGFSDLYEIVKHASNPAEEGLKQRLGRWPAASLHDALDVAALRLFVDYWGTLGDDFRSQTPDKARRFGEQLSSLLLPHGLITFHPRTYQEYPDGWLLLNSERGAVTGKVRDVIRPGLKDREGNLHVPAIVDVD